VKFRNIFISLLLLFVSCSPLKKIGIEILIPSDFIFDTDIHKVAILNNSVYPVADSLSSGFPEPLSDKELYIIDTIVIRKIFDGLFSILNESPLIFLQEAEYIELRNTKQSDLPEPLSGLSVIDFCNNTESDAFISFEYYDFSVNYYNDYAYIPEIHAYVEFIRRCLWRIYKKDGNIIDEYFLNDTVYWSAAGYSRYEAEEGLPAMTDAIRSAFFYAGEKYARRISPFWQKESRVYYNLKTKGSDRSFKKNYLKELITGKNDVLAYKACVNLALLSEKEDDLQSAMKWLEMADQKKSSKKLIRDYKKIIRERLINKEKIDKQLQDSY